MHVVYEVSIGAENVDAIKRVLRSVVEKLETIVVCKKVIANEKVKGDEG